MASISFLSLLLYLEILLCVAALCVLVARRQLAHYWALGSFLALRALSNVVLWVLNRLAAAHPAQATALYIPYFYTYWISFAVESVLALLIVYGVFKLAMAPLKGLQTLGMLVFKWAAGISVAVALGNTFAPHMTGTDYLVAAIVQLQRTQSILTLCLLLFVCFAIRPMGLNYGSRIFGVSLGLGIMSTNELVQAAWIAVHPNSMKGVSELVNGVVICVILVTWAAYFALPEPKRRIIVLPTTSPFLRWNQISQALGDNPGFVAVGGVPPELFAPAELEVMRRASIKMVTPFTPQTEARATFSRAV